jgi:hypothetical protein
MIAKRETLSHVSNVKSIMASAKKQVKTAGVKSDIHFYVDPALAEKYNINLHLTNGVVEEGKDVFAAKGPTDNFAEETITFASKRKYEPNYSCSVIFQKPDDEVYAVSAYMIETYLGRYAHKSNFYFKADNKAKALRCYARILGIVKDLRQDFLDSGLKQDEVPHHLRRALQGEVGEIEPKSNKMATYLDPANVVKSTTIGSENIIFIPTHRGIKDDLEMGG